jgi:uncharacterized RDD family membrane protein YckC
MKNDQYAGFWIRLSAWFWDVLILGVPSGVISIIIVLLTGVESLQYVVSLGIAILVIYFEGVLGGTPGKMIVGIMIQNDKGNFIGFPTAILRYIGKILSTIILCIGFIMIGWDKKKQGLHDKIAKSYVVKIPGVDRTGLMILGFVLGGLFILVVPFVLFSIMIALMTSSIMSGMGPP